MRSDLRLVKSSKHERVQQIYTERNDAIKAQQASIDRMLIAWKYYFALSGDQWPERELAQLNDEQRLPYQFNLLTPKVQTMAGAIITDLQEPTWVPIEGEKTTTTEAVKDSYYADKELTNWRFAILQTIEAGLVHGGWLEMVETKKYNPMGNIGLEYIRPGALIPDAYWKSDDDRQLKKAWKSQYFTAEGLAFKYQKMTDKIKEAIERTKRHGREAAPTDAAKQRQKYMGQVGDEYEVIEEMWLEIIKTKRLVGRRVDEFMQIPFPITEDKEVLELFAQKNNIDWMAVNEEPYEDIVYHTTAICPSLDPELIINEEKPRIQVRGLPIFHFTTQRHDGKDKGLVETIMDLQTTVNKRINLESELVAKANGGATIYNEDLFDSDEKKEREFKNNRNKPGYLMFANLRNAQPVKEEINPNQYPSQIMTQVELMTDLLPLISNVSDAWSAESSAGEAGILFERKVQMNKIATLVIDEGVKRLINNVGEAYFYQWQITYAKLPRQITKHSGRGMITLNEPLADGSIRNAVSYTPRCRVVITENINSPTQQLRKRTMAGEVLKQINPETNQLMFQGFVGMMVENMDLPDDVKEKFKGFQEIEQAVAMTTNINVISQNLAGISGARFQKEQTDMQLAKLGMPPDQPQVQEQITPPNQQIQQVSQAGPPAPEQQIQTPNTEEATI